MVILIVILALSLIVEIVGLIGAIKRAQNNHDCYDCPQRDGHNLLVDINEVVERILWAHHYRSEWLLLLFDQSKGEPQHSDLIINHQAPIMVNLKS